MGESLISYTGWWRTSPRSRWRTHPGLVAATEEACREVLRERAPRGAERLVLRGNRNPNEDR